jgi:hypothetical protein
MSGADPGTSGRPDPHLQETTVSNDAIVMLKDDHKEILAAFKKFEAAGDSAHKTKGALVDKIIELLTVHTYIENEVMYPRVRELVPELGQDWLWSTVAFTVVASVLLHGVLAKPAMDATRRHR